MNAIDHALEAQGVCPDTKERLFFESLGVALTKKTRSAMNGKSLDFLQEGGKNQAKAVVEAIRV